MDLLEKMVSSEVAYQGKFLKVLKDKVELPDGSESEREFIIHPGAVAILALMPDMQLILERQFRYPAGREFIEIPAGKIDPNEAPEDTARRELLEETGYSAKKWIYLGTVHPCIGYANEKIAYYLAQDLTLSDRQLDEGEFLEVLTLPLERAQEMALTGDICDSKTIVGLHWLAAYLSGRMRGVPV